MRWEVFEHDERRENCVHMDCNGSTLYAFDFNFKSVDEVATYIFNRIQTACNNIFEIIPKVTRSNSPQSTRNVRSITLDSACSLLKRINSRKYTNGILNVDQGSPMTTVAIPIIYCYIDDVAISVIKRPQM